MKGRPSHHSFCCQALPLPDVISASSGLWCGSHGIYTVNDSGNSPTLYKLNQSGELLQCVEIDAANTDWELLAGD
jgi:hypothetical protein